MAYITEQNSQVQSLKNKLVSEQANLANKQKELTKLNSQTAYSSESAANLNQLKSKLNSEINYINQNINNIQNDIKTMEMRISMYGNYGNQYQSQTISPNKITADMTDLNQQTDFENQFNVKKQNIGQYQEAINTAENSTYGVITKVKSDIAQKQNEINNLMAELKSVEDVFSKLSAKGHLNWNQQELEAFRNIEPERKRINSKINSINAEIAQLNTILQQKKTERQQAEQDVTQYQQGIGEQQKGMDELRVQRERYAAAMQQNRLRSKTLGMGNEMLKGLR